MTQSRYITLLLLPVLLLAGCFLMDKPRALAVKDYERSPLRIERFHGNMRIETVSIAPNSAIHKELAAFIREGDTSDCVRCLTEQSPVMVLTPKVRLSIFDTYVIGEFSDQNGIYTAYKKSSSHNLMEHVRQAARDGIANGQQGTPDFGL